MIKKDFSTYLTSDSRFIRCNSHYAKVFRTLSTLFNEEKITEIFSTNLKSIRNGVDFLNALMVMMRNGDSFDPSQLSIDFLANILQKGLSYANLDHLDGLDFKSELGSNYLSFDDIDSDYYQNEDHTDDSLDFFNRAFEDKEEVEETDSADYFDKNDSYWAKAVSFDRPEILNVNMSDVKLAFNYNDIEYRMYGELYKPTKLNEITCFTNINLFSDSEILNMFPQIRLYTRSQYMYQTYSNLETDEDLGVILKIKGFSKSQIKKNILEYPYIENMMRVVKIKGKLTPIPFWKHIEIDGEIFSTPSVWDKLPDTKNLPKTQSFMTEYVTRRYLLMRDNESTDFKYLMLGSLNPYLVLQGSPTYYKIHKLDPLEVGKACIQSRIDYLKSMNPVLRAYDDYKKESGQVEKC